MTYSDPHWGLPDPDTQGDFYASVPVKRFFAWIVDSILILAISLIAVPFTAFTAIFFFAFLVLAVSFVYRFLTLSQGSATLGMRLMAIEFRNRYGERLDSSTAFWHTAMYIGMTAVFIVKIISVVCILVTPRAQGLHDMVLGTAAINRSR